MIIDQFLIHIITFFMLFINKIFNINYLNFRSTLINKILNQNNKLTLIYNIQ